MTAIDLNADMGEEAGDDAALLKIVTSANVACGMHAGGPMTMVRTMAMAIENGVGVGAHPGFDDRANFGRTRMTLPEDQLAALVAYQVAAADGMVRAAGGKLAHLKLHGAMANMASQDEAMARTCYMAARAVVPGLPIMAIAGTAQQRAAEALGGPWVGEIFADRAYEEDATLVDRSKPHAMIHDPAEAAERVVRMARAGAVIAHTGREVPVPVGSVCCHGDTPEALEIARAVRAGLEAAGLEVRAF